jgi:thymidylate kinase
MSHSQHLTTVTPDLDESAEPATRIGVPDDRVPSDRSPVELVVRLTEALAAEGISWCHWKSNNALDRSASGENDLDLLVGRADIVRFTTLLRSLGFKQVWASAEKRLPGVMDYFGYDQVADQLIHVHAHYQLVLGHDRTKGYRLPIEGAYLESAVRRDLFNVPAPEFELIVFIMRMILKHSTWDVMLGGEKRLSRNERAELAYLQTRADPDRVQHILKRHLPYVDAELFDGCVRALQPRSSVWSSARTGHRLLRRLRANARRAMPRDTALKLWRRGRLAIRRRVFRGSSPKYRFEGGGAMIAIVGGDGAGKSTAVQGLHDWLARHFETTCIHLGKPDWSWTTIGIRAILKVGNVLGLYPADSSFQRTLEQESLISPGYPWLLRELCRARDRYRTYVRARRIAAKGGLVILDRFPMSQIKLMDGPQIERFLDELGGRPQAKQFLSPRRTGALARFLIRRERSYYAQTVLPETLIALRVDPEVAVRRKTDEDPDTVRVRSTEVWELDWSSTEAHLIDASTTREQVLSEIKSLVWARV